MSQAQNLREPGRGRGSKRQRVRHPGVPVPFCLLSLPHGGSTHKASLSHGGKHLKCPEKNPPLSGELGYWPLCPKGFGGGGTLPFFFFPLAICPENHPVLCNFGRRGLDLRLSRTRTFQPKKWGSGATGDPCREQAQRSTDSGGADLWLGGQRTCPGKRSEPLKAAKGRTDAEAEAPTLWPPDAKN